MYLNKMLQISISGLAGLPTFVICMPDRHIATDYQYWLRLNTNEMQFKWEKNTDLFHTILQRRFDYLLHLFCARKQTNKREINMKLTLSLPYIFKSYTFFGVNGFLDPISITGKFNKDFPTLFTNDFQASFFDSNWVW